MIGKLYLVATPIGNLDDITIRALKVLENVDLIAAEDTRHTLKLLNHFQISKPLVSYYKQTEKVRSEMLIEKLLDGKDIAVVSDAGMPGISDPGEEIVKCAIEHEIEVIPIPGACAFVSALVASGLSSNEFCFIGFLSAIKKEKKEKLESLKDETRTLILYEAPHKLKGTLETIIEILGDRYIVLAREITKIHEEFIRGKLSTIIEQMGDIRGEFVILIEGNAEDKKDKVISELNKKTLEEHYRFYERQELEKKEIIKKIAKDRNTNKNEIYQYFLNQ